MAEKTEGVSVNPVYNASQLAGELSKAMNLQAADAEKFVAYVFKLIGHSLPHTGYVTIAGFGKFNLSKRGPRTRYIPKTGERRSMPACNGISFKPSKELKVVLNGK